MSDSKSLRNVFKLNFGFSAFRYEVILKTLQEAMEDKANSFNDLFIENEFDDEILLENLEKIQKNAEQYDDTVNYLKQAIEYQPLHDHIDKLSIEKIQKNFSEKVEIFFHLIHSKTDDQLTILKSHIGKLNRF